MTSDRGPQRPVSGAGSPSPPVHRGEPATSRARRRLSERMDIEWAHLVVSPAAGACLRRWARREPALDGLVDLRHLQQVVRSDPARADGILAALVRLAAVDGVGDMLAARVVLQLLIPGALRLAAGIAHITGDWHGAEGAVFTELTIGVRTFPWRRRHRSIAANLLLDCRQRLTRRYRRSRPETAAGLLPDVEDRHHQRTSEAIHDSLAARMLLAWARRTGILDDVEIRLLLCNRGYQIPIDELAEQLGRSRSSLFGLRAAAERRLRDAVTAGAARRDGNRYTGSRLAPAQARPSTSQPAQRPRQGTSS